MEKVKYFSHFNNNNYNFELNKYSISVNYVTIVGI